MLKRRMFFFSDDSSILRKVQLEFVSDAKNAHLFPEKEDDPQPQRKTKKQKLEASKKRQSKEPSGQKNKKKEPEQVCKKLFFLHESTKTERYKQLL